MPEIALLSQETIDQIAAGEVVERPSSVVKELVENAIDAGATAVTVEIKEGGISFIRITDNGCGIPHAQIPVAFLRHSTSKIRGVEDLTGIRSLGFRGEALSSIAAVSQVELITKVYGELTGTRYVIEGSKEKVNEEVGAPDGTTFIVRNLFFNTPARRKFLKTAQTEGNYIGDLMERLALSHPGISFQFISNGQAKLHTSGNSNEKDLVYHIYGRDITAALLPVAAENELFSVRGFLGKPVVSRGNRNYENFFVNGRYIRSNLLAKAVEEGYKGFLMQHQYPFCVLYVQMNTELLDVNVHPTKMELRFSRNEEVYRSLYETVRQTLSHKDLIPEAPVGKAGSGRKGAAPQRMAELLGQKNLSKLKQAVGRDSPYAPRYADERPGGLSGQVNAGAAVPAGGNEPGGQNGLTGQVSDRQSVPGGGGRPAGQDSLSGQVNVGEAVPGGANGPDGQNGRTGQVSDRQSVPGGANGSDGMNDSGVRNELPLSHYPAGGDQGAHTGIYVPENGGQLKAAGTGTSAEEELPENIDVFRSLLPGWKKQQKEAGKPDQDGGNMPRRDSVETGASAHAGPGIYEGLRDRLLTGTAAPGCAVQEAGTYEQQSLSGLSGDFLTEDARKRHRIIGQLFDTYWLVQYEDKLFVIDQHAAHEKVLYERTMARVKKKEFTSQAISPPVILTLSLQEQEMLERYQEQIAAFGYEIEPFGGKEYAVTAMPADFESVDMKTMFVEMLDDFSNISGREAPELILEKVASLSCKAAVKGGNRLSRAEAEALIDELLTLENPYHCPHGRPTIVSMSRYEIEKKFKRIVN